MEESLGSADLWQIQKRQMGWQSFKLGVRQSFLPLILGAVSPIKICLAISMQKCEKGF